MKMAIGNEKILVKSGEMERANLYQYIVKRKKDHQQRKLSRRKYNPLIVERIHGTLNILRNTKNSEIENPNKQDNGREYFLLPQKTGAKSQKGQSTGFSESLPYQVHGNSVGKSCSTHLSPWTLTISPRSSI